MKKKLIFILFTLAMLAGCSKYNEKNLPLTGTYVMTGDSATFYINGVPEYTGSKFTVTSGNLAYSWNTDNDTLFKDLWKGDVLSITAKKGTSIHYGNGTTSYFLVDSSASTNVSITLQ